MANNGRHNGRQAEISAPAAAEIIGCSPDTVKRLLHAGQLAGWRFTDAGWWRIEIASVEKFIRRRKAMKP